MLKSLPISSKFFSLEPLKQVLYSTRNSKHWVRMLSMDNSRPENKGNCFLIGTEEHQSKVIEVVDIKDEVSENKYSFDYSKAIQDLNNLQSNTQTLALAKYKIPREILPLFERQLKLAGFDVADLNKLNVIHISGTKGKGSTCAFVESILRAAGLKTGFYNSPHLVKVNERIRINGEPIEDDKFSRYFRTIFDRLQHGSKRENITMPSYFSFLTILAFHIFLEENVDCAIIEVGIGGEFDPTNIVEQPIVCGISAIHYDHMNILGDTIESIASSKAGIAKREVPVFTIEQDQKGALDVIRSRVNEKDCSLYICKPLICRPETKLGIRSIVQFTNASLACQLAKYFLETTGRHRSYPTFDNLKREVLDTDLLTLPPFFSEALVNCSWPGRCQMIRYPRITFFLDGAHTKESMENCLNWFLSTSKEENPDAVNVLMVNIIGERNKHDILQPLSQSRAFDIVIFSTNRITSDQDNIKSHSFSKFQNDKSLENLESNASIWSSLVNKFGQKDGSSIRKMPDTSGSINYINEQSKLCYNNKYHVLVTGSLHFVGAILETLTLVDESLS